MRLIRWQPTRAAVLGALFLAPSVLQAQMGGGCAMQRGMMGQGQQMMPPGMQMGMPGGMGPGMQMPQMGMMNPMQPQVGMNPGQQTPQGMNPGMQMPPGMPGMGFKMPPGGGMPGMPPQGMPGFGMGLQQPLVVVMPAPVGPGMLPQGNPGNLQQPQGNALTGFQALQQAYSILYTTDNYLKKSQVKSEAVQALRADLKKMKQAAQTNDATLAQKKTLVLKSLQACIDDVQRIADDDKVSVAAQASLSRKAEQLQDLYVRALQ